MAQSVNFALEREPQPFASPKHAPAQRGRRSNACLLVRSRAGKPACREPLDAEWGSIVKVLLN
jgi:hypothetical protein